MTASRHKKKQKTLQASSKEMSTVTINSETLATVQNITGSNNTRGWRGEGREIVTLL